MINSNNSDNLVSICCTTFNQEFYIAQAIEGFLMQKTTFPFEIIIHDDASTDNTGVILQEYVDKYPNLIIPIYHNENQCSKGISPLVEFVFPKCKGKYIAICEGDDYWTDPHKLQKQVDFLEANTDYCLIHTAYLNCNEKGERHNPFLSGQSDLHGYVFEKLLIQNRIGTLTVVVRKSILIDAMKYYQLIKNNMHLYDIFLWLYCSLNSKIAFLQDQTSVYRIVKGSQSNPINPVNRAKFLVNISKIEMFYAINHSVSEKVRKTVKIKANRRSLYLNFLIKKRRLFLNNLFNLLILQTVSKKDLIFTLGLFIPFAHKSIIKRINSNY